ncbi:MAG TPA: MEDS domain-containing protein [Nocardioides sp.]|nr:MEDS domain-containing protein [Nocardioides sp.]
MRCQGLVDSPGNIGLNGHACWSYDDLAGDFRDAAVAFLNEGLELGQALMFVGGPEAEEVVRSEEPLSAMVADGTLSIAPFEAVYPGGERMPNADQWTAYAEAAARAHQGGFTGLRVLAEVTSLASPDGAWPGQARWESYADRLMADATLAALCCFERKGVPSEGLAAIASAHPVVDSRLDELVPFRLYGRSDALALTGEVDAFSSNTLRHLLRASSGSPVDRVLDLDDLTFIEHTGVQALHEYAEAMRAQGFELTIRGGPPSLHRLADLLGVTV